MTRQINVRGDPQEVFATTAGPTYAFGTRMHVPDGRVFRRSQAAGTALVAGRTTQTTIPDVGLRARLVRLFAKNNEVAVELGDVPSGTGTARNRGEIQPQTDAAAARGPFAGEYDEGMLYVVSGGGAGHVYRILTAEGADSITNQMKVTIDGSPISFTTDSTRVTLYKNFFKDLVVAEAPPSAPVVGVSPVAVPINNHFWLQVQGAAAVLQEGGLQTNLPVAASSDAQGAVRHAVVVIPPLSGTHNPHHARGVAVINTIHPGDRGQSRLAPVTGMGVVPQLTLGYVIDPGYDNAQALIHLAIEV